ncbi:MAG: hypothetical protein EA377_00815 [Phycisphaerales bacterium]|nr:MAG: hypothetical protein EA377_00815 [Phycisphaerales bacterium]
MSTSSDTKAETTEKPEKLYLSLLPLYVAAWGMVAIWVMAAIVTGVFSWHVIRGPAASEEVVEPSSLIAPDPDESRAP